MVLWELPVLGESAVQLAGSVLTEQKVHLARAQPVLRVQRVQRVRLVVLERLLLLMQVQPVLREQKVHLELLVPRRTGRGC